MGGRISQSGCARAESVSSGQGLDFVGYGVEQFGVEARRDNAQAFVGGIYVRIGCRGGPARNQGSHQGLPQLGNPGRGNERAVKAVLKLAQRAQGLASRGIGAKELTISAALIEDQDRRLEFGQPLSDNVVCAGVVFFDVVVYQVAVCARQVIPDPGIGPEDGGENFKLQREVKQVVLKAIVAETDRAILHVHVNASLGRVPDEGRVQPRADLGVGEANRRRLVQVVEDLGVEPVAVDGEGLEVACIQQRPDQVGHVVLGCLQSEEDGRSFRVGKAGGCSNQGPEEVAHAAGETADRRRRGISAGPAFRAVEPGKVRLLQGPLRSEQED